MKPVLAILIYMCKFFTRHFHSYGNMNEDSFGDFNLHVLFTGIKKWMEPVIAILIYRDVYKDLVPVDA